MNHPPLLLAEHHRQVERLERHLAQLDRETGEHSRQVAELAVVVGEELGLSDDELQAIRIAGLLHDVGKIAVDTALLEKPGPLTADEWGAIRCHPEVGERLAREALALPDETATAIRHHHERFDGCGYPDGLAGQQIPLAARIVAVVDAFDAMISDRPYRPALSPAQACAELERCAGSHFCPEVVAAFLNAAAVSVAA